MTAATAPGEPNALTASGRLTWRVGSVAADVVVTVTAGDPAVLARRLDRALAAFAVYAAGLDVELPAARLPSSPARPAGHAAADRRTPLPPPAAPSRAAAPPPPPVCAVHGSPLVWRTPRGGGDGWWSHRTADGAWCRGG